MISIRGMRFGAIGVLIAAAGAANAYFFPVEIAGTATGHLTGTTPGLTYTAPSSGFDDFSIQSGSSDTGYYAINPNFDGSSLGFLTLVAPTSGRTSYNGTLELDVTFTSPINSTKTYTSAFQGQIQAAFFSGGKTHPATGGLVITFAPEKYYYGPGNADYFTFNIDPIVIGAHGATNYAITAVGTTYALGAPAPAGALVFLVGALRRRRNRA